VKGKDVLYFFGILVSVTAAKLNCVVYHPQRDQVLQFQTNKGPPNVAEPNIG
jgi:hypothetical protein